MNVIPTNQPETPGAAGEATPRCTAAEVDVSCRAPVLFLFATAAVWLAVASLLGLIASVKFHAPAMMADAGWATYGRVYAAFQTSLVYGFAVQAGLGLTLWMIARLGRSLLARGGLITLGAVLWNIGVLVAVGGVFAGDLTGYEWFEVPGYAAPFLLAGYLFIGLLGLVTFWRREQRRLYVSQWFLVAALFWFPWIYITANLLLLADPVRGAAQIPVHLWYANNLKSVFLAFIGLAAIFYLAPKLVDRPLQSRWLAMFAFWVLIFFAPWGGIPPGSPVPAWLPAMSTVTAVIALTAVIAFALAYFPTMTGRREQARGNVALRFVKFGAIAFIAAAIVTALVSLKSVSGVTRFTTFEFARAHLELYAFISMVLFGGIYHAVPRLAQCDWPSRRLIAIHFWCAAIGVVILVLSLGLGGIWQGRALGNPEIPFMDVIGGAMMFFRTGTIGDLLLLVAHLAFLGNVILLLKRCFQTCCLPVIRSCTTEEGAEANL